jgi:hypothetical protein
MTDSWSVAGDQYFLRVFSDGVEKYETEGIRFPTHEAAGLEAVRSSAEILHDMDGKAPGIDWRMDVTDTAGKLIYRVSFKAEDFSASLE